VNNDAPVPKMLQPQRRVRYLKICDFQDPKGAILLTVGFRFLSEQPHGWLDAIRIGG